LRQHSAFPFYALITTVSIFNSWSVAALTVSWLGLISVRGAESLVT